MSSSEIKPPSDSKTLIQNNLETKPIDMRKCIKKCNERLFSSLLFDSKDKCIFECKNRDVFLYTKPPYWRNM